MYCDGDGRQWVNIIVQTKSILKQDKLPKIIHCLPSMTDLLSRNATNKYERARTLSAKIYLYESTFANVAHL